MNDAELAALKKPVIDACIKAARKRGMSDAMGVLRGTLFLEREPLSLEEISERTGYSKTTVRANMNCLENLGMAVRVVSPGLHRYKQHRYALESDAEAMKSIVFSAQKEELQLIASALNQVETDLEKSAYMQEIGPILSKTKRFYQEMERIIEIMNQYSVNELVQLLEANKKGNPKA